MSIDLHVSLVRVTATDWQQLLSVLSNNISRTIVATPILVRLWHLTAAAAYVYVDTVICRRKHSIWRQHSVALFVFQYMHHVKQTRLLWLTYEIHSRTIMFITFYFRSIHQRSMQLANHCLRSLYPYMNSGQQINVAAILCRLIGLNCETFDLTQTNS